MNPRAATNDLLPFQGSPFNHLGTSAWLIFQSLFCSRQISMFVPSGESGIRTHAPFRTNGFQDRLVMTTSISLQTCFSILQDEKHFVKSFFVFFKSLFSLVCCICRISDSSVIIPRHSTDVNTFFTIIFHFLC